jgi:[ribosomal protein S5]-alanine N-acetyltransferase
VGQPAGPARSGSGVGRPVRLVGLSSEQILDLAAGGTMQLDDLVVAWPADDRRVLRYRSQALEADPASAPYLLHVLVSDGRPVGRIGCHEGPCDETVEIGYFVSPAYRGRGVATAMVRDFLRWLGEQGLSRVRASVSPDNAASLAVLAHFGFVEVGEHWDEEDGRELELETVLPPAGSDIG